MRRFNPEKELRKIQHENKSKMIIGVITLLIIIGISSSYALYQVRYSKRIIYTKVAPFSNKDINILAVYLNNQPATKFPTEDQGYVYDHIVCDDNEDNHVNAHWDYDRWVLVLETNEKAKCSVYFRTGTDRSGANPPELYQGLIPVTFDDDGKVLVADTTKEWFNYEKKQWANAVLVTNDAYKRIVKEDGTFKTDESISLENDILQMYVWIPRYKYQLFNVNNEGVDPQEIKIEFENSTSSTGNVSCEIDNTGKETCENAVNGNWYTHPAFKIGNTELPGIWIGKFEPSGREEDLKILPKLIPIVLSISNMFTASRNIENIYANKYSLNKNEIDTHVMKNMEWGAMAFLTHSKYGQCTDSGSCTEVSMNTRSDYMTGYSGNSYTWETANGQLASTTGNIYGIYDTNGGAWEYTMGVIVDENGTIVGDRSNFTEFPEEKYYDVYEYGTNNVDHQRGHLGDATRETLKTFGNVYGGWYRDYENFPRVGNEWFVRGGGATYNTSSGIFAVGNMPGSSAGGYSTRIVITRETN